MNGQAAAPDGDRPAAIAPSITVTHRTDRTIRTYLLHLFLRPLKGVLLKPSGPYPLGSPRLTPHKSASKTCSITERRVADIWLYDLALRPSSTTKSKMKRSGAAAHITTANDIAHEAAGAHTLERNNENGSGKGMVRRIFYVAGGSWREPPSHQHWKFMAKLAGAVPGTEVTVVSVPLAPRETAPTVFPKLLEMYECVMEEALENGETVIWAGDSSGGNIVLALVGEALRAAKDESFAGVANAEVKEQRSLGERTGTDEDEATKLLEEEDRTRDQRLFEVRCGERPLPAPSALLLICPSVDAQRSNPAIDTIRRLDPILIAAESRREAAEWAGTWSLDDERISPALRNGKDDNVIQLLKANGVKVHGITAGYDILGPDGIVLRERLDRAGVSGRWLQWDKMMHCFPLAWFYGLPESKEGLHWVMDVLGEE